MIVLDTNVVSELMRPNSASHVIAWVRHQVATSLYLSTVSEAALRYGIEILPPGRRRDRLRAAVEGMLRQEFAGRVLPFDRGAARVYADIAAARRAAGRSINHADCQIAAIARSMGAAVATRDVTHFDGCGVDVIDPWTTES